MGYSDPKAVSSFYIMLAFLKTFFTKVLIAITCYINFTDKDILPSTLQNRTVNKIKTHSYEVEDLR